MTLTREWFLEWPKPWEQMPIWEALSLYPPTTSTSASQDARPWSSWEDWVCYDSLLALRTSSCLHRLPRGLGPSTSHTATSGWRERSSSSCPSSLASIANSSTLKSPTSKPIGLKTQKSESEILCPLPRNRSNTSQSTETISPLEIMHSSTYHY